MLGKENAFSAGNTQPGARNPAARVRKTGGGRPAQAVADLAATLAARNERPGFLVALIGGGAEGESTFEEERAKHYKMKSLATAATATAASSARQSRRGNVQDDGAFTQSDIRGGGGGTPTLTVNTKDALADIMGMFDKPLRYDDNNSDTERDVMGPADGMDTEAPTATFRDFTIPLADNEVEKTCTIIQQLPVQKLVFDKLQVYQGGDGSDDDTGGLQSPAVAACQPQVTKPPLGRKPLTVKNTADNQLQAATAVDAAAAEQSTDDEEQSPLQLNRSKRNAFRKLSFGVKKAAAGNIGDVDDANVQALPEDTFHDFRNSPFHDVQPPSTDLTSSVYSQPIPRPVPQTIMPPQPRQLSIMTPITEMSAEYLSHRSSTMGRTATSSSHVSSATFSSCFTGVSKISATTGADSTMHTFRFQHAAAANDSLSQTLAVNEESGTTEDSATSSMDDSLNFGMTPVAWPNSRLQQKQLESAECTAIRDKTIEKESSCSHVFASVTGKPSSDTAKLGDKTYKIMEKLGEGAYGNVYMARDDITQQAVAIKVERPPSAWEYHILTELHRRLVNPAMAARRFVKPIDFWRYADESYLLEPYMDQPSLLSAINTIHGGQDTAFTTDLNRETIAMVLVCDLLRIVDSMHQSGIIHGDLKADNLFLRNNVDKILALDNIVGPGNTTGLTCLDFGKAVDVRQFDLLLTKFQTVSSASSPGDTVRSHSSMLDTRSGSPWQWDIDFIGAAGVVHALLFGKYWHQPENTTPTTTNWSDEAAWQLVEKWPLRRYWQTELWLELLRVLVCSQETFTMRWFRLREIRGRMERFLRDNRTGSTPDAMPANALMQRLLSARQ